MKYDTDVIIVGAGPIGIACGVEAADRGISAMILEKGCLANSIFHYPLRLIFFSAPRLLELGKVPFVTTQEKPTREDVLGYYRRVAEHFELNLHLYEAVEEVESDGEEPCVCRVVTSKEQVYTSRFVILAIGAFDHPNLLGIPGEELPKVSHYYREAHPHYGRNVAVVGGQNSAAEAALELWRHGAKVTLIHRGDSLGDTVKYWIRPNLQNRIQDGSIRACFRTVVERIEPDHIMIRTNQTQPERLENDFVFVLTGYHTDFEFLQKTGVVMDVETLKPLHDPATMETSIRGVYIAGVAAAGKEGSKLFIENTRFHAKLILQDIERKLDRSGLDSSS